MAGTWLNIGENMESWMSYLPDQICRFVPIIHLAIPGSHVSASYSANLSSPVSPDCQSLLSAVGTLVKPLLLKWSVTQRSSVAEQLRAGVRYLDLKLASCSKGKRIHTIHWLYGGEVQEILIEIDVFLRAHKQEIIIIDFNQFHQFSASNHFHLRDAVKELFGNRLCPLPTCLFSLTLNSMRENGYQVIVIYRDENPKYREDSDLLWPSQTWLRFRPHSRDAVTMLRELERDIAYRPSGGRGYISVCAITPDSTLIRKNMTSNLDDSCAKPCQQFLISWIDIHRPGHAGFNVLVADFVNSIPFCETVVALNRKLLR